MASGNCNVADYCVSRYPKGTATIGYGMNWIFDLDRSNGLVSGHLVETHDHIIS
jgi:hypothetical protein